MTAVPRPAVAGDVAQLHALREAMARWTTGAGIRQWRPGEVEPAEVAAQGAAREWHVLRPGVQLLGARRLLVR